MSASTTREEEPTARLKTMRSAQAIIILASGQRGILGCVTGTLHDHETTLNFSVLVSVRPPP